jgi:predicted amidophosphoribosyltransferase
MAELATDPNELCPSCGGWVEKLDPGSGWCSECTLECHPDHTFSKHRWEMFLARHADRLEELMHQGLFLTSAMQVIRNEIRPNCVICGTPLKGGNRGRPARFCGKHEYAWYRLRRYRNQGFNQSEALQKVIDAENK